MSIGTPCTLIVVAILALGALLLLSILFLSIGIHLIPDPGFSPTPDPDESIPLRDIKSASDQV